jgi:hypothetical protein
MDQTATPGDASVVIPAGWYEDPAGQSDTRWWDGANWTAHTMMRPPVAAVATTPLPQQIFGSAPQPWSPQPWSHEPLLTPAVPPWSTPYIWILSVLPLAELTISWGAGFIWGLTFRASGLGVLGISLTILFVGLFVLFTILDYRALGRLGYEKRASPVLIIVPLLYMGRRAAAVRRVTRKGLLPLFVFMAGLILFAVVTVLLNSSTPSLSDLNQRQLINIEQGIQTTLAQQNIHVTVTCPADAPSTPLNVPFTCTATDSSGASAPITAHFDAPHHFIFEPPTGFEAGS